MLTNWMDQFKITNQFKNYSSIKINETQKMLTFLDHRLPDNDLQAVPIKTS